jgi:hypothetical protein
MDDHAASEYARQWEVQPVPMRPSRAGLEHYRKVMCRVSEPKVLIFGATPELTDLAISIGASRVLRFDLSLEILRSMQRMATQDWSSVELLQGDWLKHQAQLDGQFDCVVCDGGLLFLEFPGQWSTLFRHTFGYLKPGGSFCFKGQAHPNQNLSFESLRDERIARFKVDSKKMAPHEHTVRFWHLVAHLGQLCMIGLVAPNGKIDKRGVSDRMDATGNFVMQIFPEKKLQEIAREALHRMFRAADRMPVLEYLTPPDLVPPYLEKEGFLLEPVQFLVDSEPLPDYCYQVTARKPVIP